MPTHAARGFAIRLVLALALILSLALFIASSPPAARAASSSVVISQVYGGGGATTGSPAYRADYIELFNRGTLPVSIQGWSLQYASATGAFGGSAGAGILVISSNVTIPPGGYYLVQTSTGAYGPALTPSPDLTSTLLSMSASNGRVALATDSTWLNCTSWTACQGKPIVDQVAYGATSNSGEGNSSVNNNVALDNTKGAVRKNGGCEDTDNNNSDFDVVVNLVPRNSASATNSCNVTPNLSINDVTLIEGNSGPTTFTFSISLSAPAPAGGVSFDIATQDNTAVAPGDYTAQSLTGQTIPAGSSSYSFDVSVNGDTEVETDETFFVNVTNVTGANVTDGQGVGAIKNDDAVLPDLSINDVSLNEGDSGTTTFSFTVSLSILAPAGGVTFDIWTSDNTAAAPGDYTAKGLTAQTIPEGSSNYTFDVVVNGDTTVEPDETFNVNVTKVTGANVTDGQGLGTIKNDDVALTRIHDIQGAGAASPLAGQVVTVQGVVVGDYQKNSVEFGGFFLEEEDADQDADPLTSEGIFVYCREDNCKNVSRGDLVRLTGTVTEYNGLTELTGVSGAGVQVMATGASVTPVQVTLPVKALTDLEAFEGMLVTFPQTLSVTEVYSLGRYGQVDLSVNGRLSNPTNVVSPGAPAVAVEDQNVRSRIILDDGINSQNPDPEIYPAPGLSASNTLRVGDATSNLTGVLDYRFSAWRIQPVDVIAWTHSNPRPAAPASVGGNLKVAGLNMLNYFTDLDDGTLKCGPTGGLQCRGANNATEFTRQRTKLINAIAAISPDLAGLMEIENAPADAPTIDLVNGLNAAAGVGTFSYIATGPIGTDAIKVAIIYKPGVVTPVGPYKLITSSVNPLFDEMRNRPALAQTFELNATHARLTIVVNHLKSKGSCPSAGDPNADQGDGQSCWNLSRTNAATALTQWLATDPTNSGDPDVILVGDMNAYAKEDPITAFKNGGYSDLVNTFLGSAGYSYVFSGETGYLDHALASSTLAAQVTGVAEWHINADEPIVLDYNTEYKSAGQVSSFYSTEPYRASDHDPVVVGIQLNAPPSADAGGPYQVNEGSSVTLNATGSDPENGPLTYAWDLDNSGSFETTGQSVNFSAANLDGPGSYTVKVQVTDNGGLAATGTATVTVQNVAPTATFNVPTQPVAGTAFTLSLTSPFDPSSADTLAGFKYAFDCGGGTGYGTFGAANSKSCTPTAKGDRTVKGKIKDKDGGVSEYMAKLFVLPRVRTNLSIVKTVAASPAPSSILAYTLAVKNAGPSAAANLVVTDVLPLQVKYLAAANALPAGCSYSAATRKVRCSRLLLGVGATWTITVRVKWESGAVATNCATVSTTTYDTDLGNNQSCIQHDANGRAIKPSSELAAPSGPEVGWFRRSPWEM